MSGVENEILYKSVTVYANIDRISESSILEVMAQTKNVENLDIQEFKQLAR